MDPKLKFYLSLNTSDQKSTDAGIKAVRQCFFIIYYLLFNSVSAVAEDKSFEILYVFCSYGVGDYKLDIAAETAEP